MGGWLLSHFSPESLSGAGFDILIIAMLGEVAVWLVPDHSAWHKHAAFIFAALAVAGYAIERVGDDAIVAALDHRASAAEAKLADRTLSDAAVARIGAAASAFPGQRFTMNTYWQDPEPTKFTKRIGDDALVAIGHWQFVRPNSFLVGRVIGVTVDVSDGADEASHKAAAALVGAIKAEYPDAKLGSDQADNTMLSITVGAKR